MYCACIGQFHRPPIFYCVAEGLSHSSLNPIFLNKAAAPLRFVAALVVAASSPIFAMCDLLIYLGACIAFPLAGHWDWALENIQDTGRLLVRLIPDTVSFPFLFAYDPGAYSNYAREII